MTEHKFSFPAAEFLRKYPVSGKMFNFFDIGGFLDWKLYPQALTFIDGRTYNQEVFMEHQVVTGAMSGWEKVLEKYGITYIVLKSMDSSGMILPIVPVLANSPGWALVFSDGLFVVFVRNTQELGDTSGRTRSRRGSFRSTSSGRRITTCFSGSPRGRLPDDEQHVPAAGASAKVRSGLSRQARGNSGRSVLARPPHAAWEACGTR